MTQGNPWGRGPAPWPTETRLRAWARAGRTLDEIARLVEDDNGGEWRPSRPVVSRKLREIGEEPRRLSHADFMPRGVKPEHNGDELRRMLEAESRVRQSKTEPSDSDRRLVRLLDDLINGHRTKLVIGYDRRIGWYLRLRRADDGPYLAHEPKPKFRDEVEQAIWDLDDLLSEDERLTLIGIVRAGRSQRVPVHAKTG